MNPNLNAHPDSKPDANSNSNLGVCSFGVRGCTNPNPNANQNPHPDPKSDASSNSNLGVQCFGVRGYMNPKPNANPTLSLTLTGTQIWGCGILG